MGPHSTDLKEATVATDAGWRPDPTGRYEWRYWDGGWTNRVASSRPSGHADATATPEAPTVAPTPAPAPAVVPAAAVAAPASRPPRRCNRPRLRRHPPPTPLRPRCRCVRGTHSSPFSPRSRTSRSHTTPIGRSTSTATPTVRACSTATRPTTAVPASWRSPRGRRGRLVPALALRHDRRDPLLAHGVRGEPRLVIHHRRARARVRGVARRPAPPAPLGGDGRGARPCRPDVPGPRALPRHRGHDERLVDELRRPRDRHVDHGGLHDRGPRGVVPTG